MWWIVVVASGLALSQDTQAQTLTDSLTFKTQDGYQIRATLALPSGQGDSLVPGVVLIHSGGGDRSEWNAFIPLLNQRGYAALAYDIRGSGGSTHLPEDYTHRAIYDDPEMAPHDLRAALSTLRNMDTVDAQRIAVVGASIGGNLAVVASAQFDVQAAVSISPKTSAVRNLAGRDSLSLSSVYYISSSLDQGGKRKAWVEELYGLTTAPKELDIVQGTGHGVYIFAEDPQLPDRIVAWLDTQLKKAASQP
ncbi:MAG: alpha/beta fold hydrolase [Gemmatimonadetes bacterium]|jgi:dienelactone hydrolase|nr:alpha/beta fold hydrolase [Gemmatimonadota bacterium]MBT5057713.1 alpha/beta fold hydrolase [Gemmatimonadota bacterium]MBT5141375.1 alpha/beta fold hydrolase [Gemmatimonadota bacterium]MBT5590456.1 alpha/beta fold hydrolase [Gemmatimonadota bacterium]MBT5964293.1 alpha/beta fold hydrolase [Gemmatimonadota bacterium]